VAAFVLGVQGVAARQQQFLTRGYRTSGLERDRSGNPTFAVLTDRYERTVGIWVTYAPGDGDAVHHWIPTDIRWGTDVTAYSGGIRQSPAELVDYVLETIAADNTC
jgi:hypothetical protein